MLALALSQAGTGHSNRDGVGNKTLILTFRVLEGDCRGCLVQVRCVCVDPVTTILSHILSELRELYLWCLLCHLTLMVRTIRRHKNEPVLIIVHSTKYCARHFTLSVHSLLITTLPGS